MKIQSVQASTISLRVDNCFSQIYRRLTAVIEAVVSSIFLLIASVREKLWGSHADYTVISQGSQWGCNGFCPMDRIKQVCARLNANRVPGVFFNEANISQQVVGGACSSMALEFIDRYLQCKTAVGANPVQELRQIGAPFSSCSEELRIRQAAFNAINKHPHEVSADFKRDKIGALLQFHQRRIISSSEEVDLSQGSSGLKLHQVFLNLPRGAFAVRVIDPSDNHKGEVQGHSMVLINESWGKFFYDPNYGIHQLHGDGNQAVSNFLQQVYRDFHVSHARFYQVS